MLRSDPHRFTFSNAISKKTGSVGLLRTGVIRCVSFQPFLFAGRSAKKREECTLLPDQEQ
jgi:hypothetical protein